MRNKQIKGEIKYELGTWSIKENRKINRKRREFKNKDYWGKKPEED